MTHPAPPAWCAWWRSRDGAWEPVAQAGSRDDAWALLLDRLAALPRNGESVVLPANQRPGPPRRRRF